MVAVVLAALPDQRLLFAEQRLVARQQRVEVGPGGPHGVFQQVGALFVEIDQRVGVAAGGEPLAEFGETGNRGGVACDAILQARAGGGGQGVRVRGLRQAGGAFRVRSVHRHGAGARARCGAEA